MFNWTAFPESLDNNYDELESTGLASPSIAVPLPPPASTPLSSPQSVSSPMLALPRSASTSQIDSASPIPHFETSSASAFPHSTGSRSHQRTPGVVSLSETGSPMTGGASRHSSSAKHGATLESTGGGVKTLPNSYVDVSSMGSRLGSREQQTGLSLDPPTVAWWYAKKSAGLPDFVLISEFSEIEGPKAVMTIPDNIVDLTRDSYSSLKQRAQESSTKHSRDSSDMGSTTLTPESNGAQENEDMFDIHEFVLRITSVDQQSRETSGGFHIPEDIEVHVSDAEKGYWAYVHHFTLFDINARGFVRPFSMSYVTRDPNKILEHYEDLRQRFSRAALYFKTGNYTLFRQDLTRKLRDLNYTNNLLSEAPGESNSNPDTPTAATLKDTSLPSQTSQDTLTHSPSESLDLSEKTGGRHAGGLSEQQKADLESINDAIETATHIISMLEHYSIDGQPLLGHAEDGHEGPPSTVPLNDLSPMTSSENLAMLAACRSAPTDPSLFLGASSRSGARVRHKGSTPNVSGTMSLRILDTTGGSGMVSEGLSAPSPHLLGLQQDQSRKNSVVSECDPMMYETTEYEAQYVTSLYPIYRDEVVFRPLRELCIANMVWNSSIQFHLGVKKIKDLLKEFQADSQLLGESADSLQRMRPTSSALTIGQRFLINFHNPDFNRTTARPPQHRESPVPPVELLQEISLADVPSDEELIAYGAPKSTVPIFSDHAAEEREPGLAVDAEDADDEQTGYDSLDDAASFFTAATGVATQTETPTREAFFISPLDRSARVVEWHQEQQTLHHAKGAATVTSSQGTAEQVPWAFAAGMSQGEQALASGASSKAQHRQSVHSGTSMGIMPTGAIQSVFCPTIILDTLQKDPTLAKHLAFALLGGQKVCIMGQSENESKVRTLVSVLATFLPHAGYPSREEQLGEHQRQSVTWYQGHGLLQVEDMQMLCLVGVDSSKIDPKFLESDICIVDYDTFTWINGRQYTDGVFLESIFRNMSIFSEDASFLAFVDGTIFDILLKAFLYYHLVLHGKLYLGGPLAHSGAQAFYSSGASDDGEAFSYQHNFRGSRQLPSSPKSTGIARLSRRDTSTYPSSAQLGKTALYKNSSLRSASLSSQESSDVEKSIMEQRDLRRVLKYEQIEDARRQQHERIGHNRLVMSGDESNQRGGPMQYTTSQGMRKWKKWFEYWSAKSVAMIDPALAAFGRSDSAGAVDGTSGSGTRRKRNSSRRSSPQRRPRNSPSHHPIPGRHRDVKDKEKGRDREREKERSRKSAFDNFNTLSEKPMVFNSSESESNRNHDDMAAFEKEVIMDEKGRMEYMGSRSDDGEGVGAESRIDDKHANLVEALAPLSKNSGGLRRLKPKRPLLLQRVASRLNDMEHEKNGHDDGTITTNGEDTKRNSSSGSAGSPPHSATFRSLAGAIRAMSFGHPSSSTTVVDVAGHLDAPSKGSFPQSLETQGSPRSSRDLSDSNHANKEAKRRGSTRAKAKAWLKSKRKKRSRVYEGEQFGQEPLDVGEHEEDLSEEDQESGLDIQDEDQDQSRPQTQLPQEVDDSGLTVRAAPKLAPKVHPTIQEIASQDPTKIMSRVMAPTSSALSSGNNSSRVSSAAPSRITSPTALSFSAGHRQKIDPTPETISLSKASSSLALLDARSEINYGEYDSRQDPGRESATEYETSLETFTGMDSGNLSSFGSGAHISGGRPSVDSSTRNSLDAGTAGANSKTLQPTPQSQLSQEQKETEKQQSDKEKATATLMGEEEAVVREMLGGVIGSDDWSIIVYLATIVDQYERGKEPVAHASNEP